MDILDAASNGSRMGGPTFGLRNRLFRAIWIMAWGILASWTPPPLHGWRRIVLRVFGAKLAGSARIYGSCRIWYPPNLHMGVASVLGPGVICYNQGMIRIGDFSTISQRAHLCSGTHLHEDINFQLVTRPITIGKHVWIATEAFVGPGVTVADGVVLGARGVLTGANEEWTVMAGNPARKLKTRRRFG